MLGFGTLVFVMRRYGYPAAPFVLGLVLGDILDKNLRRGLVLSDGDLLPFFTRPISALLAILVLWTFVTNVPTINARRCCGLRRRVDGECSAARSRRFGLTHMRISLCNEVIAEHAVRAAVRVRARASAMTASRSRRSR